MITSTELPPMPMRAKAGSIRELVSWYLPYLRGYHLILTLSIAAVAGVLVCQAVIPLIVDALLHDGEWNSAMIGWLVLLIILQLNLSFFGHLTARRVCERSATVLRSRIFEKTLVSEVSRQGGLARTSIVYRHTSDVDAIAKAFEATIVEGIPGIIRVIQSLILLSVIDWRAGTTMTIAALAFLILRWAVGRSMIVIDHRRLDINSRVGEQVDESLSSVRTNARLHMGGWQVLRFRKQIDDLELASEEQSLRTTQLETGAHTAGLIGLVLVVVFALLNSDAGLVTVAAALLYVEGVVRGLESLPPWIRYVQLGLVSEHRVDRILLSPDTIDLSNQPKESGPDSGLAIVDLTATLTSGVRLTGGSVELPRQALIGLVTPTGSEPDHVLALLAGAENPESGRVQLDGLDVRMPGVNSQLVFVAGESVVFNASVLEQIRAVAPAMGETEVQTLLDTVGLGHLEGLPGGLTERLGPMGARLTVSERQRLSLAIGMAVQPRVLLVGSLLALADVDAALPIIRTIRDVQAEYTIVSVHHPEVAESLDVMLFINGDGARVGTHHDLLVHDPDYARMWELRLTTNGVDLSVLGIADSDESDLQMRLVTERYAPGDVIYRQGDEADRIIFTISGQVEVCSQDSSGQEHRVATLGPGNHLGDLRLVVGEKRAESAYAIDNCVVRSLSREAVSAGMMGLLERSPTERRIVSSILRDGPATASELQERLTDIDPRLIAGSIGNLLHDGALRDDAGQLTVVQRRAVKAGARDLLERILDL